MRQLHQKVWLAIITGVFSVFIVTAQTNSVGIGTPFRTQVPNTNAVLHLESDANKPQGFLMPRIDRTKFVGLTSAENGLIIYDQTDNVFYYWLTNRWVAVGNGGGKEAWTSGAGNPDNSIGKEGDFYFNTLTNILYRKGSLGIFEELFKLGYTAGAGISINNGIISNSGDPNAADDITNETEAGGDLTGKYPNPTLSLKSVTAEKIAPATAGNMQLVTNGSGVVEWVPTTTTAIGLNEIAIGNGAGVNNVIVSQDATLASDGKLTVTGLVGKPLNTGINPTANQVLIWNGSQWTYADISTIATLTGDVKGTLSGTKVTALQNYPVANVLPQSGSFLQWNGSEWIPSEIVLGGDAMGSFDDVTVSRIQNRDIANTTPANGQVLTWNSVLNKWEPAAVPTTALPNTANGALLIGNGSSINTAVMSQDVTLTSTGKATVVGLQGKAISLTSPVSGQVLIYNGSQWNNSTLSASGDVTGSLGSTTVTRLQNRSVDASTPSSNDVLTWNGSQWTPKPVPVYSLPNTGNGNILIGNGSTVNNVTMSQDVMLASNGKATVTGLQGKIIDSSVSSLSTGDDGKVLTWDGTTNKWTPKSASALIKLENQSYATAQTRYYSVDPTEFVEVNTSPTSIKFNGVRGGEISSGSGSDTYIVAPLHLPHGATVTEITFLCFDNTTSQDITFYYTRNSLTGSTSDVGSVSSYGSSGSQSIVYSANDVVDNQNYSYKVAAVLNDNAQQVYGVRIKYTVTKPD
ncbi:hypothetical protein [Xanthocytophaga agilis]|uniref:Uncharacterized protein n=1 Tax=Xanthocytophaga agilis TaxID=3048010 RepID=A0AAE3R627_9BACT|nr:hypothetical protein [Xanthocytophaga agilis]MDJ1504536.1 hypothetical protein [Xanthocytophaga agilis]